MVRCVRVPKAEGNPVRMGLKAEGLLDLDHRIGRIVGRSCGVLAADVGD